LAGLSAAIVLGPILLTLHTLTLGNELRAYAATLDDLDRQARAARAAGERELRIQRTTQPAAIGLDQIGSDAASWPNTCVAAYYGVDRVVAVEPPGQQ
jgi:hypothetical protein